jgi:enoyl-CoA hydratase/carnithine racemase
MLYKAIKEFPLPVVTSSPGYAVGAGWQVYLLGDYRISSENGKFAMTEIDVGIPCITGGAILKSMIGLAELTRLILMCEVIDANEVKRLGLVHKVVPADQLQSASIEIAGRLAKKPPTAVRLQREWFRRVLWLDLDQGIKQAMRLHRRAFASGEPQERMRAFVEKGTQT